MLGMIRRQYAVHSRQAAFFLLLLVVLLPVLGVGEQAIPPQQMVGPQAQAAETVTLPATLYFRYRTTGYLAREMRQISVPRPVSWEMAVIKALLDGPGSLSPHLNPLFPPGTQVLSVAANGDMLFVTFNERLLSRYPDEAVVLNQEYSQGEGHLRRRLAMAGLVNTLTEDGRYARVQVLVRHETNITASMRLSNSYYLLDSEGLPDTLSRSEGYVLTPQTATGLLLDSWKKAQWTPALSIIKPGEGQEAASMPTEHELRVQLEQAPRLADYFVSPGTVALDGQSAMVVISLRIVRDNGTEQVLENLPLRLLLREGIYAIPQDALQRLLEGLAV